MGTGSLETLPLLCTRNEMTVSGIMQISLIIFLRWKHFLMGISSKNRRLWCADQRSFCSLLEFQNPLADSLLKTHSRPCSLWPWNKTPEQHPGAQFSQPQLIHFHVFWAGSRQLTTPGQGVVWVHWCRSWCVGVWEGLRGRPPLSCSNNCEPNRKYDFVSSFLSEQHLKCYSCQSGVQRNGLIRMERHVNI